MAIVANDPLMQLAFSVHEGKGVYCLLLGSGISRAAEVPTGWEITLDLIRRVALARGETEQVDWAAWYRTKTGHEPDYSAILAELAASPEERRAVLHSYIEPTEEDRAEGRKVPTAAHNAIADLVRGGYVRVIITTNFDRLIENALRERGIEPTVIASVDALAGAEPIIHSQCYVLKLHGDYKDARILNTEAELSGYPDQYNTLLDRIFDEHGLIVSGWSGEWDHALRAAILRAPNRRYPVFWAARGEVGDGAKELVRHRGARVIPVADADSFFSGLFQQVETLDQTRRKNPVGIELLVSSAKRFLAKPEYRIQLDELLAQEANDVLKKLDDPELTPQKQWGQEEFRTRIRKYEAIAEPLASVVGVLGRWGDGKELPLVVDIIRSLCAHADKIGAGNVVYLEIRAYPAVLVFFAYGLGLVRAERWNELHSLFDVLIHRKETEPVRLIDALFLEAWSGGNNDYWGMIEGLEKRKTPLSDHLASLFQEWSIRFAGLTADFELMYERFEMLGSLAHLESISMPTLQQSLAQEARQGFSWMPVGRIGWHRRNADKIVGELQTESVNSALLKAGFAKGSLDFLNLSLENFGRIARRMRW